MTQIGIITLSGRSFPRLPAGTGVRYARDEGSSLVWLGVAVLICIGSLRLSLGSVHNPGPGFFPFVARLIMGILSAMVYVQARRAGFFRQGKAGSRYRSFRVARKRSSSPPSHSWLTGSSWIIWGF